MTEAELRMCAVDCEKWLIERGDPLCGDDWAMMQVVRAYLAEHPADDDMPVTTDWVMSLGFTNWEGSDSEFEWADHWFGLARRNYGDGPEWLAYYLTADGFDGSESYLSHVPTRGHVRRLCAALNRPLKEKA